MMSEQFYRRSVYFPAPSSSSKLLDASLTFAPDVLRHLSLHIIVIATAPYICTTTLFGLAWDQAFALESFFINISSTLGAS
jgi:hypothetical protein